jgi:AbiV family abortive infection protein
MGLRVSQPDQSHIALLSACVVNARALLDSAKAVVQTGHHNIAYHLATLALEELGKREIYQLQSAAKVVGDPPAWQINAVQDHVRKLFWCLCSLGTISDIADQAKFFDKREAASDIHRRRLAGLYVHDNNGKLSVPSEAVSPRQADALIKLAEVLVGHAETQKPREDIPQEEIETQVWFLNAMDDSTLRARIFNQGSIARLKELDDLSAWTREIKANVEAEDASLRQLAERELNREPTADATAVKDRWKIRIKLETTSNSIRPAFMKEWNSNVTWMKLMPVQGDRKKDHLLVEFTLGTDVPVRALWSLGLTLSLRLIIALNFATSGFWWWQQNPNKTKFYESISDLETKHGLELDSGGFEVFQQRAVLTEVHAKRLVMSLTALPDDPRDPKRGHAYTAYLGGLSFLAVNSITWRCEDWAFGQFARALKGLMNEANYLLPGEPLGNAVRRFLDQKYPSLDRAEFDAFTRLIDGFEAGVGPTTKIGDVYLTKLLCEDIFRDLIIPKIAEQRAVEAET